MTFAYTVTISDPTGAADDALLLTDMKAALDAWSVFLAGQGTVDVSVTLDATDGGDTELAEGSSDIATAIGRSGGKTIYEAGAAYELAKGQDPNGATADVDVALNPTNLPLFYFNPNPSGGGAVPAGKYDLVTVLTHELGHGFGIAGFRNDDGSLPSYESNWDKLVQLSGKTASFVGGHVEALYGGAAPITTLSNGEAYYHFGNSASDADANDLMSGTGLAAGVSHAISPLDVAVMADLDVPLSNTGTVDLAYATELRLKSFADLGSVASTITAIVAQMDAGATFASEEPGLIKTAGATTTVALLAYEFFTGATPSGPGLDYLVSPEGPNSNNLNSAYYQSFSLENRYINFAVNLGDLGAGQASFSARYAALSLSQVVSDAYTEIFGVAPSAASLNSFVNDPVSNGVGGTETRAQYFAGYGHDDLGTKAAAVGWLLAEAVKADTGSYATAADTFLTSLIGGTAQFGADIVATHHWLG